MLENLKANDSFLKLAMEEIKDKFKSYITSYIDKGKTYVKESLNNFVDAVMHNLFWLFMAMIFLLATVFWFNFAFYVILNNVISVKVVDALYSKIYSMLILFIVNLVIFFVVKPRKEKTKKND